MAEVLRSVDTPVTDGSRSYHPRIVGRRAEDGMWEGWLEFVPIGTRDEDVIVGPVESRQPEYEHLTYWASGLTPVFLEGALWRAQRPIVTRTRIVEEPVSDVPAPRPSRAVPREIVPDAVLDPFSIAEHSGIEVLAQELRALSRMHLQNIIAAFNLNPSSHDIAWMTEAQLARFIVVSVEAQMMHRSR